MNDIKEAKKEFPFKAVYDFCAKYFLEQDVPTNEQFPPQIIHIGVDNGVVIHSKPMPATVTNQFFKDGHGKELLGRGLRQLMDIGILGESECIVTLCEAYVKTINAADKDAEKQLQKNVKDGLASDKTASEVVLITIYRPEATRLGGLPITKERKVIYAPMLDLGKMEGRLAGAGNGSNTPENGKGVIL